MVHKENFIYIIFLWFTTLHYVIMIYKFCWIGGACTVYVAPNWKDLFHSPLNLKSNIFVNKK